MSGYLLDTCTLIWLCAEPEELSETAVQAINSPDATLLVSDVSAMEIALKWQAGKIELPDPPRQWLASQVAAWMLECLPLSRSDMYRASGLPAYHRDPFDRLLVAVALNHNATILSPDKAIHQYPVSYRW